MSLRKRIKELSCKIDGAVTAVCVASRQEDKTPGKLKETLEDLRQVNQEFQDVFKEIGDEE